MENEFYTKVRKLIEANNTSRNRLVCIALINWLPKDSKTYYWNGELQDKIVAEVFQGQESKLKATWLKQRKLVARNEIKLFLDQLYYCGEPNGFPGNEDNLIVSFLGSWDDKFIIYGTT